MEPVSRLVFLSFTDLSNTEADAATLWSITFQSGLFSDKISMSKLARIAEKELRLARDWKQKRWISMKQKHETLERYWENEKCWRPPRWKWGQWKRANTNTYDISSIKHITRKFHIAVVSQLFFFFCYLDLLIFLPLTHCRCHSALHNKYFIFCLNIYYNYINKSFAFSPG